MSRALDTAKSQQSNSGPTPAYVAGKNLLINGGYDIWQRGISASMTSTVLYLADRWESIRGGYTAGMTVSRQSAGLSGFQYCARIQRDSGNTSPAMMYHTQSLETINSIHLQGKTVTLSFWARAGASLSSASTYLQPQIECSNTTDQPYRQVGDGTGTTVLVNSIKTLTTTWQKFTTTATILTNATQVFVSFKYSPSGTAGAADYYEIAGVQLEIGSDSTPFSRSGGSIQGELAACQRYFEILNTTNQNDWVGDYYSTTNCYAPIFWKVTKRVAPTLTLPAASSFIVWNNGAGLTPSAVGTDSLLLNGGTIYSVSSSRTAGSTGRLRLVSNTISVSAEI
jgi:hypothetical protein